MSLKINYSYLHLFQNISSDFFLLCNVYLGRVTARVFWNFSPFLSLFHQFPFNSEARMCSQSLLMRTYYCRSESLQWLCISFRVEPKVLRVTSEPSKSKLFNMQQCVCVYLYIYTNIYIYYILVFSQTPECNTYNNLDFVHIYFISFKLLEP